MSRLSSVHIHGPGENVGRFAHLILPESVTHDDCAITYATRTQSATFRSSATPAVSFRIPGTHRL